MQVPEKCPRVVVNTLPVGEDMGLSYSTPSASSRDHLLVGQCDQVLLDLSVQLGWEEDLFTHYDDMSEQGQQLITAYRCSNDFDKKRKRDDDDNVSEGDATSKETLKNETVKTSSIKKNNSENFAQVRASVLKSAPTPAPTAVSCAGASAGAELVQK